tara:strand:+ start:556 stop:1113 length:558 start_codon:yes stop_codon:yes gene_type:complete
MEEQNFLANKFLFFQEKSQDDYFYNALIYVFEHNENGALGLIINKSLPIDEDKIFSSIGLKNIPSKKSILNGGPVEVTKLFILHDDRSQKESISNINGLCLTSSVDFLKDIGSGKNTCNYKLALGYCGWDAGQLDYEIRKNSWHIIDFNPLEILKSEPEELISIISKTNGFDIDKIQNTDIITKH